MGVKLEEPMFRILRAQQANIARIATDLEVDGTDAEGNQVSLWGPRPDVIRLYDTPLRMFEDSALEQWERLITLNPVLDSDAGRVVGRSDRDVRYQVQFMVRLTEIEIARDRSATSVNGVRDSPLAVKAHKLVYDFHHVFFDNHHLITDDCAQGLVDDARYDMRWDPGMDWPYALFVADVAARRSGW